MRRIVALACLLAFAAAAPAAHARNPASNAPKPSKLEAQILDAVRDAGFDEVLDGWAAPNAAPPWYPKIPFTPQVDVAVFDLSPSNRVREAVNVLMSRDYPQGVLVPIGKDLDSSAVRYRKWDASRWFEQSGKSWSDPYAAGEDVVPGREGAPLEFMIPYPASVLKVLVAYGVLRLVDDGTLTLETPVTYTRAQGASCYRPSSDTTTTVREWMTVMITESSNVATCALIKLLHDTNEIDDLNAYFASVGLPSLRLENTNANGGSWSSGRGIHMGGLDTAKLMWLVDGAPGVLWRAPSGRKVTNAELSDSSRDFFKYLLSEQGFNEVLSTTNWCGATLGAGFPDPGRVYPQPGIPNATPDRFILDDGTVEVEGVPYGQPVAACNAAAEVEFSHKTGLVSFAGADAGFVHELPGAERRDYVIAVFTNIGNRFTDPVMNTSSTLPEGPYGCWTERDVCYSESFAKLGASIDRIMQRRP